jgi:hypothetical protein
MGVDAAGRDEILANAEQTSSRAARSVAIEGCDAARCGADRMAPEPLPALAQDNIVATATLSRDLSP